MAWEIAGYVVSLAILLIAGAATTVLWRLNSRLRQWDRQAARLAQQAEAAVSAYTRLAEEAIATAEQCRRTMRGFSRLSEGAEAVGKAAETVAMTAADAALYWCDRLTAMRTSGQRTAAEWTGLVDYFADLGRRLLARLSDDASTRDDIHSGTSADNRTGE